MTCGCKTLLLASVGLCLGVYQSLSARAQINFDPVEIQEAFGRAKNFELITSVSNIPADGQQILDGFFSLSSELSSSTQPLADLGMDWSSTDVKIDGVPSGQHLFSAVSDQFVAILFMTGGWDVHYNLILAPRNSSEFCWFRVPPLHASNLRLRVVQDLVRPDRDQTISKTPECRVMRTGETNR